MKLKYTQYQVPRGSLPDAETLDKIYLIKNVSELRATYQIKLLAYRAAENNKKLIIKLPDTCKIHGSLKRLIKETGNIIKREES